MSKILFISILIVPLFVGTITAQDLKDNNPAIKVGGASYTLETLYGVNSI